MFKARHIPSGELRAIKIIEKKKVLKHEILMTLLQNEFEVLQETVSKLIKKVLFAY